MFGRIIKTKVECVIRKGGITNSEQMKLCKKVSKQRKKYALKECLQAQNLE